MFNNHPVSKNCTDEAEREKFISRAMALKNAGIDITEQSKVTGSFLKAFFTVSVSSAGAVPTHEEKLGTLSKKYAEMRDELAEMFKDDEDEYYRQMDRLNVAFKSALESTCLTPIYSNKTNNTIKAFTLDQEAERIRFEEEAAKAHTENERYNKNVQEIMKNFRDNLLRHVDIFYERFINNLQSNDYDTAFQESMSLLKEGETTSYNEISYSDMVNIMDTLNNVPTAFDENGMPTKMRYNTAEESFQALLKNAYIPYLVRKAIANCFGLSTSIAEKPQESNRVYYTNAQGERMLKIVSDKGTRHIKLGLISDVFWTDTTVTE